MTTRRGAVRVSAGAAAVVLALAGCSDGGGDTSSEASASSAAPSETSAEPTEEASGSTESEEGDPRAALEQAVETTAAQESAQVRFDVQTDVAGQSGGTSGEGVVALGGAQRARLSLTLPPEAGGGQVEVRVIDGVTYVQLPEGETGLPPQAAGKFIRVDPAAGGENGLGGLGDLGGSAGDLNESLEQLRNAESVEAAGEGEVEGDAVTLYTVTTSTAGAASPVPEGVPETVTYTVAVDEEDLVRQIESTVAISDPTGTGAGDGNVAATFTIVEYGVELDVQEPSADEVIDLGQLTGMG